MPLMKAPLAASSPVKAVKTGAVVRVDAVDKATIAAAVGRMVKARVARAVPVDGVVRAVRETRGEVEAAKVVKAAVATGWALVVLPVAAADNDNPPIKLSRSIGRH